MVSSPQLLVISGPSGVGKGTLVKELLAKRPDLCRSVSVTTRKPRPGEVDGVDYYFIDEATFDRLIQENSLLEWATVHGARYGTPEQAINQALQAGKSVVFEIDVQGARAIKEKRPDALLVFVHPPSLATLRERLEGRATETPEAIERRLAAAESEIAQASSFDAHIVNDDLATAIQELLALGTAPQ